MQIIYGYSNCTDKKYSDIFSGKKVAVLQPDQKYHGLLIKGLSQNGVRVRCLSGLPISRYVTSKIFIKEPDEREGNATYHYYTTFNLPVVRQIMIFFGAVVNILKHSSKDQVYAMCDCLNVANAYGIILGCRIRKIPVVAMVTDLPSMFASNKVWVKLQNKMFEMFDGFVFLTEQMNNRVNTKKKPYIVLEGHVDVECPEPNIAENYETSLGKKIIIYAGSIQRLYGVQNLVEGFLKADIPDAELHIWGDGDYRNELVEITQKHETVKYRGVCCNEQIVHQEQKAMLLVNPRPSFPEYTKYSFPSKNMEYMVSGTPVLTTKLPGMPEEYYPYIYLIEDETSDGISDVLRNVCEKTERERNEKGILARRFVLEQKSNIAQARKIIKFLCEEVTIK